MEQKKHRKSRIVKGICCILAVLLIGGMVYQYWYKPKNAYHPKAHTNEELLALFEENRPLFDEVAQIIARNDSFWNEAKSYKDDPYDTHPWIGSPDEKNKMKLFTEDEQAVLRSFFEKIGPYMIILDISGPTKEEMEQETVLERPASICLRIDFTTENTYSFAYYYGSNSHYPIGYNNIQDLGNNWFCFTYT